MRVIENYESEVRSYVRSFPVVFDTSKGAFLFDEQGNRYIDFFAGAGTLNYGHNNDAISQALITYIQNDGIVHGLDKATVAKKKFMEKFVANILEPRNLEYKIQFSGPTGTNAVETALKLARMVKQRSNVIAFTNAFHGLTSGSMAVTGNSYYRDEAFINRANVSFMPFDGYFGPEVDTAEYLRKMLSDKSSGVDIPAAIILETIQAEGGINVASPRWLKKIEQICREFDILLIVDDIQVGNGRTGHFFSFEESGITPDIITLSKSIGGGLPLAMVLMKPELDQWKPGEHTGTFRGNNLAFVASTEALSYWENNELSDAVFYKEKIIRKTLQQIADAHPDLGMEVKGRGMIWGLKIPELGFAGEVSKACFGNGLVIELAGADDDVVKFLPPLVIDEETLREGLAIVETIVSDLVAQKKAMLGAAL